MFAIIMVGSTPELQSQRAHQGLGSSKAQTQTRVLCSAAEIMKGFLYCFRPVLGGLRSLVTQCTVPGTVAYRPPSRRPAVLPTCTGFRNSSRNGKPTSICASSKQRSHGIMYAQFPRDICGEVKRCTMLALEALDGEMPQATAPPSRAN